MSEIPEGLEGHTYEEAIGILKAAGWHPLQIHMAGVAITMMLLKEIGRGQSIAIEALGAERVAGKSLPTIVEIERMREELATIAASYYVTAMVARELMRWGEL